MPGGFNSHADYMAWVQDDATTRHRRATDALLAAFGPFIEVREAEVINFSAMTALDLAHALGEYPLILKPICAACNVASRAIERDLDICNLDAYKPRLSAEQVAAVAGYLKPFLPQEIAVAALTELDRHFFVDKQVRMLKGRWERAVRDSINEQSALSFKKRAFRCDEERFELDIAAPPTDGIDVGVDVKRIEARRDIHKRCDEIVNKAAKFKRAFPSGKFAAVIYYPFTAEHVNVQHRLESPNIDAVVFASQSQEQLRTAIGLLVDRLGIRRRGPE